MDPNTNFKKFTTQEAKRKKERMMVWLLPDELGIDKMEGRHEK